MPLQMYRRKVSKDEINKYPMVHYPGEIRLVQNKNALHTMLKELEDETILGFDTETRPSFRKGVQHLPALIQLASSKAVYLVQLTWLPLDRELANILSDKNILKAGFSIYNDMLQLKRSFEFEPAGVVDLGEIAKANKLETLGLRNLAANLFDWRISKACQCSNWSLIQLTKKQIRYAATDAWIGRLIYLKMQELGML